MVLSEAMVLHSALGAPRWHRLRSRSVAIHSGHRSSGSPVLSPSRWGGGGGGGGEAGEAGTRPCNFPKENHPSLLPTPPCVPADVSGRCPQLSQRWLSLRRPRSKPSPVSLHERTLRQADNSAPLFLPLRPSRGSHVHHAVRPSVPCALLGQRLLLCRVPEPRPPARAPSCS